MGHGSYHPEVASKGVKVCMHIPGVGLTDYCSLSY